MHMQVVSVGAEAGVGVSQMEQARDSDLLAVACDDFVVRVYDLTTRKLVSHHHHCHPQHHHRAALRRACVLLGSVETS
jgi:hypothetical protein